RAVDLNFPGRAGATETFERGGTYRIWIAASTGRPLEVGLDGRKVGEAGAVNTNGEWLPAGSTQVSPGAHRITLTRQGGNLAPGDGYRGVTGPLVFQRTSDRSRLIRASNPDRFCGKRLDWIEAVRRTTS